MFNASCKRISELEDEQLENIHTENVNASYGGGGTGKTTEIGMGRRCHLMSKVDMQERMAPCFDMVSD